MSKPQRKAFTLLYTAIAMVALLGFLSLSIDLGRARVAKSQLRDAVDAAIRYAATGISDGTYLAKAQAVAAENLVDGTALVLQSSDVELGTWDSNTKVFTATNSSPTALRITGCRIASRGTAIPLVFGRAIGMSSVDIRASSIACGTAAAGNDIVGITAVTLTGGTQIRRLASEGGTVKVASNGAISVPWGCYIYGDAYYRGTAPSEPGNGITGTNTYMTADLSYPATTLPGTYTDLGVVNVGSGGYTCTAGNYRATSITIGGGGTVTFTGDVNIYCSGAVNMGNGCTLNTSNGARKVTLYLTSTNTADFNMSSTFYMRIYGPSATLNLNGSSPMVGACVVKNLNIAGSANISYSSALAVATQGGSGAGSISTVK